MENEIEPAAAAPEAPAPAETPAAGAPEGQPSPDEKTSYTKDEVSTIVQERLKAWQKYGKPEELETRLSRAEQLERFYFGLSQQMGRPGQIPGQAAQQPETEEDKKVRAYMERIYPGLGEWQKERQTMQQAMAELHQRQWQAVTAQSQASLKELAIKAGYKEEQLAGENGIEQRVADSIRGNPQDLQAYMKTGDPAIVRKHFEALDKWVKGFSSAPAAGTAQYAADKKKTANLPPRIPAGGVPAPTASKKKLTNEERVGAAFKAWTQG